MSNTLKFTVPREAWYYIRYSDGTTETKLMPIGSTLEFEDKPGIYATELSLPVAPTNTTEEGEPSHAE